MISFQLTPEQEELRARIRELAARELAPTAAARDEREEFPRSVFDAQAGAGLGGLPIPAEYGGGGRPFFDYILALEEIGKVDSSQVLVLASHLAPASCILA